MCVHGYKLRGFVDIDGCDCLEEVYECLRMIPLAKIEINPVIDFFDLEYNISEVLSKGLTNLH